jgi:hypothetical protein
MSKSIKTPLAQNQDSTLSLSDTSGLNLVEHPIVLEKALSRKARRRAVQKGNSQIFSPGQLAHAKKLGLSPNSAEFLSENWDGDAQHLIAQLGFAFNRLKDKKARLTPKLARDILDFRSKITSVLKVCPSFYGQISDLPIDRKGRSLSLRTSRLRKLARQQLTIEEAFDGVTLDSQMGLFSNAKQAIKSMNTLAAASETLVPGISSMTDMLNAASSSWSPEDMAVIASLPLALKNLTQDVSSTLDTMYTTTFVASIVSTVAALLVYSSTRNKTHLLLAGISGAIALATTPESFRLKIAGWVTTVVSAVLQKNKPSAQFGVDTVKDIAFAGVALLTGLRAKLTPATTIQSCWDYFTKHAVMLTSFTATITAVIKCAEWICNKFALVLGSEKVFHFLDSSSIEIDQWSASVDDIWRQITLKKYSFTMLTYEQVTALCAEGSKILKALPRSPESISLSHFVSQKQRRLEEIHKLFAQSNFMASGSRQEPVSIILMGAPGAGKTIMATYLHAILCARSLPVELLDEFKKCPDSFMYNYQSENNYHDGYQPRDFTCLLDDFGQIKDVAGVADGEYMNFIRMKNSFPMNMHMASMDAKSNTFFKCKYMIATTNDMNFNVESIISKEALLRRMDLVYKIDFNPEYCKQKGNGWMWDATKLPRDKNGKTVFTPELCKISRVSRDYGNPDKAGSVDVNLETPCTFDELVEASLAQFDLETARYLQRSELLSELVMDQISIRKALNVKVSNSLRVTDYLPWGIMPDDLFWSTIDCPKESGSMTSWILAFDNILRLNPIQAPFYRDLCEQISVALSEHYMCKMLTTHTLACVAYAVACHDPLLKKFKGTAIQQHELVMSIRDSEDDICLPIGVDPLPEKLEAIYGRTMISKLKDSLKPPKGSLYSTLLKVGAGVAISGVIWKLGEKIFSAYEKGKENIFDAEVTLTEKKEGVKLDEMIEPPDWVNLTGYCIPTWFYALKYSYMDAHKGMLRPLVSETLADVSEVDFTKDLFTGNDVLDSISLNAYLHSMQANLPFTEEYFMQYLNSYDFNYYLLTQTADKSDTFVKRYKHMLHKTWENCTSWFKKQEKLPEAQSFGHSDRMRTKIDAVKAKLCGKSLPVAQMGTPYGNNAQLKIDSIIRRNTYEFYVETVPDIWDRSGFVTFLRGKTAIMPAHFITGILSQVVVDSSQVHKRVKLVKCKGGKQLPERLRHFECEKGALLEGFNPHIPAFTKRDLALVEFESFPKFHADITKYWGSQKDLDEIRDWNFSLEVPFNDNPKKLFGKAVFFKRAQPMDFKFGLGELMQGFRYTAATCKGECGALFTLLTNSNTRGAIYGLHSAGLDDEAIGFASAVSREELLEWLTTYPAAPIEDIDAPISTLNYPLLEPQMLLRTPYMVVSNVDVDTSIDEGIIAEGKDSFSLVPSKFDIVGVSPLASHSSGRSRLLRSHLYDAWGPATTRPCHLRPFTNVQGERIDPYELAINKYGTPYVTAPEELLCLARRGMLQWLRNVMPRTHDIPVMTFHEAVAGHPCYPEFGSLNRSSSNGFPYTLMKEFNGGRKRMWGPDGDFDFTTPQSMQIETSVDRIIRDAKQGFRGLHVYIDCLKDERRPHEKVESGKTRMFSAGPLDLLIATRMYFAPFVIAFLAGRIYNGSAVGMNPYSREWNSMVEYLCEVADPRDKAFGAGDQHVFDAHQKAKIVEFLGDVVDDYLESSQEDRLVRRILLMEHHNSKHLIHDVVYEMDDGIPSGGFNTMVFNCLYNIFALRCAWLYNYGIVEEQNEIFDKNVKPIVQGDDNVFAVSAPYRETFTEAHVAEGMAVIGLVYTSDTKGEALKELRPLSEINFLKRRMVFDDTELCYIAPLDLTVILEIPYWTKKKANMELEITRCNVQLALDELSLHGREVFDKYAPLMRVACRERLQWVPIRTEYETCKKFILSSSVCY